MVVDSLLRVVLFFVHFWLFVARFWIYNWIRAAYYYLKFGPLFLFVRLRIVGLERPSFGKVPRSIGLLVAPNTPLLPSLVAGSPNGPSVVEKRKSNQLTLSPLGAFLEEARTFGIQRVVLFLYPKDFAQLQGTPLYQGQIKPLEPFFTVLARSAPSKETFTPGAEYDSFVAKNANPLDLIISYEQSLRLFGIPPLSLMNTEFSDSSWCSMRPFSNASLLAALTQFSRCQQRFGK